MSSLLVHPTLVIRMTQAKAELAAASEAVSSRQRGKVESLAQSPFPCPCCRYIAHGMCAAQCSLDVTDCYWVDSMTYDILMTKHIDRSSALLISLTLCYSVVLSYHVPCLVCGDLW